MAGDHREPVSSAKTGPQERSISDVMQRPGMAPKPEAETTQDVFAGTDPVLKAIGALETLFEYLVCGRGCTVGLGSAETLVSESRVCRPAILSSETGSLSFREQKSCKGQASNIATRRCSETCAGSLRKCFLRTELSFQPSLIFHVGSRRPQTDVTLQLPLRYSNMAMNNWRQKGRC